MTAPRIAAAISLASAALIAGSLCSATAYAAPTIGAGTLLVTAKGDCTIGFTLTVPNTTITRAVTAGHCVAGQYGVGETVLVPDGDDSGIVGRVTTATALDDMDYAFVDFDSGTSPTPTPIAAPGKVGDPVCKIGATTGRTCGRIITITDTEIIADPLVRWGDSGGPLVNSKGAVIGIVSRSADANSTVISTTAQQLTNSLKVIYPRADRIVGRKK